MRFSVLVMAIATLVGSMGAAHATVVSGRVTNSGGSGIPDVDLDFIDRNSGESIALVNDNTDFLGFYAVTVPEGDYDVRFEPLPGDRYVGFEERGFRAEGAGVNLDMALDDGFFISGRVVDDNLTPLPLLDLDFVDAIDGAIFVANDRTDVAGNFSVVVPASEFSVQFDPGVGSSLVPKEMNGVVVAGDTALGDVTLVHGFHLTGVVVDQQTMPGPEPITGVRVETMDATGGVEIYNLRNNTDDFGAFDLVVAPGPLSLQLIPSRGDRSLPRWVAGLDIQGDVVLPTIALDEGVRADGIVLAPGGGPAVAADLDFFEGSSGLERFTPRDNTDDVGEYSVAVAQGMYQIGFAAPGGSGWAPAQLDAVDLTTGGNLPTVQLQPGHVVSGIVQNGAGSPLAGVDLDFRASGGGSELLTSQDKTGATGAFSVVVPAGTYDIEFSPVDGSGFGQVTLASTPVAGNVNLGVVVLPSASAAGMTGVTPTAGSALGGTLMTVTGSNFAPGVKVSVGGATLSGVTILNSTTVQGTTRVHPTGTVDVTVTNPGAGVVTLSAAFTYTVPPVDPVLTLTRTGPLDNDVLLQWNDTGRGTYRVFRSTTAPALGDGTTHEAVFGTQFRDDGAGTASVGALLFYRVY